MGKLEVPMIIAMKGHPGSGKSTLAKSIASALKIPLIDKDDVKDCTLPLQLTSPASLLNDLSYDAIWQIASTQLTLGLGVILDSPLSRSSHLDRLRRLSVSSAARLVIIECRPADRDLWRRRLEERARGGGEGHKPATWKDLEKLLERSRQPSIDSMDNSNEASSSMSFLSSQLSNGSSNHNISSTTNNEQGANIEILSLNKLSGSLEKLLVDAEYDYSDAEILVEEIPVGIHRCILASRSQFFHELFKKGNGGLVKEGKPRYLMSDLVPYGAVGYEAFLAFLHYLYTGKLKASPPEVTTCVDESCVHDACRPAINFALELMFASATFQMKELVLLFQRHLLNFVDKALVEDVIHILLAAHHYQLNQLLSPCIQRVARSDLDDISLEKELPHEVVTEIKSLRVQSPPESTTPDAMEVESVNDKSIKRILKALDSDDVELLMLLLEESSVTLDDAYALHYACAYCDSKVVQEVLTLGLADILLKNPRGHTVLHVAARRRDPSILVALLTKGACASETTRDGQTALSICQRLTRRKDYHEKTVQCKESHKDRLCVDVLQREMRRSSMSVNMSVLSQLSADDLHMRLDYLENRVAFARLLFPAEARVAIENAEADSTLLYANSSALKGNIKEVDLNETPSVRTRKLQLRLHALVKTVENGRRFFPHCSEVLDKFLEDDMPDVFFLDKGSEEEQRIKKTRFMELKDEVQKAFHKDMAENNHIGFSSSLSSSSSTRRDGPIHKVRKR